MYEVLIETLRAVPEYDTGYAKLMHDAADAIAKLTAENKRLKNKIRDMKSSASWDEDIQRGQVQGMW